MCNVVTVEKNEETGFGFPKAGNSDSFRNRQNGPDSRFRHLSAEEINALEKNGNTADSWDNVLVTDPFTVARVRYNRFLGKVRLGAIPDVTLKYHDLELPAGITFSTLVSSDIGDCCAVHNVSYLSRYIVRERCILFRITELQCTDHSKFGNGFLKEGEDPSVLVELMVMNENGKRSVLPFEGMKTADAFLWANWPEDREFTSKLKEMTFSLFTAERGEYGEIGKGCVIKSTNIIKDVKFGECCYVKGATKLKNLTVRSSEKAPVQIGESCELVNGIIGFGCKIFYGCKAVRFIMGENSQLKYGARLINSMLGENSTVSCCELLSNLIFPFHEQHHNNSFLISALIMGQSNIAAGANLGSNHNSRGADGELRAGRGFWPALSSSIKYDSRFASFVLITKGNYDYELNVHLPFALVSDNRTERRRVIMPAYWWLYNMYALERNADKFSKRDGRVFDRGRIETDYLAPDTVREIRLAMKNLCRWYAESPDGRAGRTDEELEREGLALLNGNGDSPEDREITAGGIENSPYPVHLIKVPQAYRAYDNMLFYYGTKELVFYCYKNRLTVREFEQKALQTKEQSAFSLWYNLGGRLVPEKRIEKLRRDVKDGVVTSWDEIHALYEDWDRTYDFDKAVSAYLCLRELTGCTEITQSLWNGLLVRLKETRSYIDSQVSITREKDYNNPFRMLNYKNPEERDAVLGEFSHNEFITRSKEKTASLLSMAEAVMLK